MTKHRTGDSEVERDLRKMKTAPQALTERTITDFMSDEPSAPAVVDRGTFQAELDALRVREKAHIREGDAIAAARRRLPMVEVDGATPLIGERGAVTLLDAFEGRRMLIAYYFMWNTGDPAPEQCEGCTWVTSQVRELSYIHSRDVTYATFCQGPYEESARYREFMGWEMPWYSAQDSLDTLLVGRRVGMMHIVCYRRQGSNVFETYWTTGRGVEAMDNQLDLGSPQRSDEHQPFLRSSDAPASSEAEQASVDNCRTSLFQHLSMERCIQDSSFSGRAPSYDPVAAIGTNRELFTVTRRATFSGVHRFLLIPSGRYQ